MLRRKDARGEGVIPPLCPEDGCLPLGRYIASLDEVAARFVHDDDFQGSATRSDLWAEWQAHLISFQAVLGVFPRVWLAGSFITSKLAPSDIDVFYGMPAAYFDLLTSEDLEDIENLLQREWCVRNRMRIDAYGTRLPEDVAVDDLRPSRLDERSLRSFQELGIYDEIWQRVKLSPTARRGYLEVRP